MTKKFNQWYNKLPEKTQAMLFFTALMLSLPATAGVTLLICEGLIG